MVGLTSHGWFDILEITVTKLELQDRPDLIWNAAESGLPSEPKKCQVVSERGGQQTLQIVTRTD